MWILFQQPDEFLDRFNAERERHERIANLTRALRGAMLAVWDDILPPIPRAEWNRNRRTVAGALAEDGGRALA